MNITLREITKENYEDVCGLELADHQKRHLSSNMESILESKFHEALVARAIYLNDDPVGFIMGAKESASEFEIFRFMIALSYQKKGIGRAALEMAIAGIRRVEGIQKIKICYHPDNTIAKQLYLNIGFKEVGMDEDGEDMWAEISV